MKASKSAKLITMNADYNTRSVKTIVIKPTTGRKGSGKYIKSRIGLQLKVDYILDNSKADENLAKEIFDKAVKNDSPIFIDEVQFVNTNFLSSLMNLVQSYDQGKYLSLKVFGLLKTYKAELFDTSKFLVEHSDNLIENITLCDTPNCPQKAIYTLLLKEDQYNDIIVTGDKEYKVYCSKHYVKNRKHNNVFCSKHYERIVDKQ